MSRPARIRLFALVLLAAVLMLSIAGCGEKGSATKPDTLSEIKKLPEYKTLWTDPSVKLEEISGDDFTRKLYLEEQGFAPEITKPGTQVYIGFYSGPGNHGNLVKAIDAIGSQQSTDSAPAPKVFWCEGTSNSYQFPSYVTMLREHWYDRAYPAGGKVTIFGESYKDPHTVTPEQADKIWGQYSQHLAKTAELIFKATGKPVIALCFVQGAKANRIFYTNEFPALKELEKKGAVRILFAKTPDADYQDPAGWTEGSGTAPPAVPAQ